MKVEVIKRAKLNEKAIAAVNAKQLPEQSPTVSENKGPPKTGRKKRWAKKWEQGHPGLRMVFFAIDSELWDQFIALCCTDKRPNVVVTRMIQEAVQVKGSIAKHDTIS